VEETTASSSMAAPTESQFLSLTSRDGVENVLGSDDHHKMRSNCDDIDDEEDDEEQSTFSVAAVDGSGGMIQFDPAQGIREPNANDVVCGRGRSSIEHPANQRFRDLINQHKDMYQKAKRRDEKTKITCELVDRLRQDGRYV
jgi:hypothetical protein